MNLSDLPDAAPGAAVVIYGIDNTNDRLWMITTYHTDGLPTYRRGFRNEAEVFKAARLAQLEENHIARSKT